MMRQAAALAVLVTVGGCNARLRIGVVIPETGDAGIYGASVKSGVKLAFDDALARRTAPLGLEVLYRDSGSDPARAASAAEALFETGAVAVIGGVTSAEAKALIPVADRMGCVLLSPSASAPDLARRTRFFFRVYPSDELEGVKAADFLVLTRGTRTVFVLQEDNDYTRGLLPVFVGELTSRGGRITGSVRLDESGWQGQVREMIARHPPDGVYICGYGEAILGALRLLRNLGFRGTICTTSAFSAGSLLARAASPAEGVFFPLASLDVTSRDEPVRSFVSRYKATYNLFPDIYAAHGYDAALALLASLRGLQESSGSSVAQRLRALSGTVGVMGPIAFTEDGDIRRALRNHWIHGGKVEDFDSFLEKERRAGGGA
ncbi:MAG: ABC transporter substrate-binding protein [Acidobacteriia bacterium]|nr:ABC transporter substrate-binding protein [Terriglobia bacterium]